MRGAVGRSEERPSFDGLWRRRNPQNKGRSTVPGLLPPGLNPGEAMTAAALPKGNLLYAEAWAKAGADFTPRTPARKSHRRASGDSRGRTAPRAPSRVNALATSGSALSRARKSPSPRQTAHRVALDERVGVLARDALLRQRQQHPLRMDEAAEAVEVLLHVLGIDDSLSITPASAARARSRA